ncbi:hypothetical protein ACWEP5_36305 [Nocardia niigatensis]
MPDLLSDPQRLADARETDPDTALFAEYLAFDEVVPFEQSKASAKSLVTLATASYGAVKGITTTAKLAAPLFGPHAPVVYAIAFGTDGGVAVANSIGLGRRCR